MKNNIRDSLKLTGLESLGLLGYGIFSDCPSRKEAKSVLDQIKNRKTGNTHSNLICTVIPSLPKM